VVPRTVFLDFGVSAVILRLIRKTDFHWGVGAIVLVTLATVVCGCGPSQTPVVPDPSFKKLEGKAPDEVLTEDQLYKYVGTGEAKRKVQISRDERVKLLHEAAKKGN
jgi:hypothetical protein